MWKFTLILIVTSIIPDQLDAQVKTERATPELQPLHAEKPWPFTRRDPGDEAPRDRIPPGPQTDSQAYSELYLQVKKFYDEGGQQWLEVGVDNTLENAIEHLIEEHHFTREQLRGYDVITLNWIHGMAHERGNPESPDEKATDEQASEETQAAPSEEAAPAK